ncbi:hypothetical protein EDD22DRAFT_988384 [Suillus occidentalis]|nr:hypothetical protein EDD22DRAFT_988384 [Suillus occidentalis]
MDDDTKPHKGLKHKQTMVETRNYWSWIVSIFTTSMIYLHLCVIHTMVINMSLHEQKSSFRRVTGILFRMCDFWVVSHKWPLFDKKYRRSCYALGLYSNAEGGTPCNENNPKSRWKIKSLEARSNIRFHHAVLATQALDGGISSTDTATKSLTPPTSLAHTHPLNMTFVSDDPSWWPIIDTEVLYSYWTAAASVVVAYDWALTIGQEIELIWIRYIGIPYSVASVLQSMPNVSLTDAGCNILSYAINWTDVVMTAMLDGSRTMLLFLVIIFLAVNIACVVLAAIALKYALAEHSSLDTPEELIFSGIRICSYSSDGDAQLLCSMIWMLNTVWEVLALCLSVWIAVKHFRDLRRLGPSTGSTIGDCFRVLMKSHVLYFASLSPAFLTSNSIGTMVLDGILPVFTVVQMFVLGPRLILSVRECHAKLVAGSDADTSMNSIVFQEHVHISTSGTV